MAASKADRWCERRLFAGSALAEPVAASTGIVMLALFLVPNVTTNEEPLPAAFVCVKACLVLLALGTVIFHSLTHEYATDVLHVNLDMLDWYPLVLACASLIVLYTHSKLDALLSATAQTAAYACFGTWVLFLLVCMDSATYNFWDSEYTGSGWWGLLLNALLLAPLLGVLVYCTWTELKWQALRLWALLAGSAVLWAINVFACERAYGLAVLHGMYHLVMAVALVHAACLGLDGEKWELVRGDRILWLVSEAVPVRVRRRTGKNVVAGKSVVGARMGSWWRISGDDLQ